MNTLRFRVRCPRGHSLAGANASWQADGRSRWLYLTCRQCNRERAKAWRAKNAHRLWRRHPYQGETLRPEPPS